MLSELQLPTAPLFGNKISDFLNGIGTVARDARLIGHEALKKASMSDPASARMLFTSPRHTSVAVFSMSEKAFMSFAASIIAAVHLGLNLSSLKPPCRPSVHSALAWCRRTAELRDFNSTS